MYSRNLFLEILQFTGMTIYNAKTLTKIYGNTSSEIDRCTPIQGQKKHTVSEHFVDNI